MSICSRRVPIWRKKTSCTTASLLLLLGVYASLMWQLNIRQNYYLVLNNADMLHFTNHQNPAKARTEIPQNQTKAGVQFPSEHKASDSYEKRTIYTYVERLNDENGMLDSDWDGLIRLWETKWKRAGFKPVVLTVNTHTNLTKIALDHYGQLLQQIAPFNRFLFRKWLVLATQTIHPTTLVWYADVDVFPLRPRSINEKASSTVFAIRSEALNNSLILMEKVAPSFVVGKIGAWRTMTDLLLQSLQTKLLSENANQTSNIEREPIYWTDTLAILDTLSSNNSDILRVENKVLSLDRIPLGFSSHDYTHEQFTTTKCPPPLPRWLRSKWILHVGPRHLPTFAQTQFYKDLFGNASNIPSVLLKDKSFFHESLPAYVLPRDRMVVAEHLLAAFEQIFHLSGECQNSTHS